MTSVDPEDQVIVGVDPEQRAMQEEARDLLDNDWVSGTTMAIRGNEYLISLHGAVYHVNRDTMKARETTAAIRNEGGWYNEPDMPSAAAAGAGIDVP
jgi:hypothetical protein